MSKVRVAGSGVSLDGFGAGIEQSLEDPLGKRGPEMFQWFFHTKTFCSMVGKEGGTEGDVDDTFAQRSMENFGAFILGRNMFGPGRGPWPDDSWKGWWGDDPPYHAPTFVLTHYDREPLVMKGGTTFHFVTGGFEEALVLARKAAGSKDVKIGGGVATVRQYLGASLIDSLHIVSAPVLLGQRDSLFDGLDLHTLGFSLTERKPSEYATHLVFRKSVGKWASGKSFISSEQGAMRMLSTKISNRESTRLLVSQAGRLTRKGQTGHSTSMSCSLTLRPASVGNQSPMCLLPDYSPEVVSILSGTVSENKARKRLVVASETVSTGTTWRKPLTGWTALWSYKRVWRAPKLFSGASVYVEWL